MAASYDRIGTTDATTRRPDPRIREAIPLADDAVDVALAVLTNHRTWRTSARGTTPRSNSSRRTSRAARGGRATPTCSSSRSSTSATGWWWQTGA
jgi:hypothetical protein